MQCRLFISRWTCCQAPADNLPRGSTRQYSMWGICLTQVARVLWSDVGRGGPPPPPAPPRPPPRRARGARRWGGGGGGGPPPPRPPPGRAGKRAEEAARRGPGGPPHQADARAI